MGPTAYVIWSLVLLLVRHIRATLGRLSGREGGISRSSAGARARPFRRAFVAVVAAAALGFAGVQLALAVTGPTASFGFSPQLPTAGQTVTFANQTHVDPAFPNDTLEYQWFFGDDTAQNNETNPQHVFAAPGVYTAT